MHSATPWRCRSRPARRPISHRRCRCSTRSSPKHSSADKGYDADALIETLDERGITPVIPPKANRREPRKTDFALYRERNLVERFFSKLKQYRALATRYDKLANTFLAAVALVCVLFWLN